MNQDAGMWWFQLHRFDPCRGVILRPSAGVTFGAPRLVIFGARAGVSEHFVGIRARPWRQLRH